MKTLVVSMALAMGLSVAGAAAAAEPAAAPATISGAGGSSPAPLVAAWGKAYNEATGVTVIYQPQNSAFGIAQIEASAVDFGDTEAPMKGEDLDKNGLIQFPWALSGLTPVVNMPGIESGQLKLDGPVLAGIFQGAITKWNDPKIAALNPGMELPDWAITVAHRSDKAALTLILTTYLSAQSPAWKAGPGAGDTVNWPVGLGGKGNAGIAEIMSGTLGTIGYVEYAYAKKNDLPLVVLKSHDGAFVKPDGDSIAAAAAKTDWAKSPGFYATIIDQPGAKSWPMVAASYVLIRKDAPAAQRQNVLNFFDWGFKKGDETALGLGYIPLPASVKTLVRNSWPK